MSNSLVIDYNDFSYHTKEDVELDNSNRDDNGDCIVMYGNHCMGCSKINICICDKLMNKAIQNHPELSWEIEHLLFRKKYVKSFYRTKLFSDDHIRDFIKGIRMVKAHTFILQWIEDFELFVDYSEPKTMEQKDLINMWIGCAKYKGDEGILMLQLGRCRGNEYQLHIILKRWTLKFIERHLPKIEKLYSHELPLCESTKLEIKHLLFDSV